MMMLPPLLLRCCFAAIDYAMLFCWLSARHISPLIDYYAITPFSPLFIFAATFAAAITLPSLFRRYCRDAAQY